VSVEGLWRQTSTEQVSQTRSQLDGYTDEGGRIAFADLERKVVDRAMARQAASAAKPSQKLSGPWPRRVAWLAAGTVLWVLARLGVRYVFGDGAMLLEYVLLILILGAAIGMASLSEA